MSTPKKFNLDYMDQLGYLEGYHRSGWSYVMQFLYRLHDSSASTLLDTYVDRTFHWKRPSFLPYTQDWVGFVHHTFDTTFSTYNNVTLFNNQLFLDSLPQCRGLYVFSQDQADRWNFEFNARGYDIPVQALFHPAEFVPSKFTLSSFTSNPDKKLVQIGAWLRDNYAIYKLNRGQKTIDLGNNVHINKAALRGMNMDHYFKPNGFFRLFRPPIWKTQEENFPPMVYRSQPLTSGSDVIDVVSVNGEIPVDAVQNPDDSGVCRDVICRDSNVFLNKYVVGALSVLEDYDNSVSVLPTLSNTDYDDLLAKNIVYIKLWDAAAVNTLIECIVRDTPIVINRLPAVVEVLGEDYPLYADTMEEAETITFNDVQDAYTYLHTMDKSFLSGDSFLTDITSGSIYSSL
jgi:hypothetical protein